MIDPDNVTNYTLTRRGLEEQILFWLLVAGKNAGTTARALAAVLAEARHVTSTSPAASPFAVLRAYAATRKGLRPLLKRHGVGCHGLKARGIAGLLAANLDLKHCPREALLAVPGVGPKTANCFLLHTRPDQAHLVGLDTHMLAELRERRRPDWPPVPATTPPPGATYAYWSARARELAVEAGLPMPAFDLAVFRRRRVRAGRPRSSKPKKVSAS